MARRSATPSLTAANSLGRTFPSASRRSIAGSRLRAPQLPPTVRAFRSDRLRAARARAALLRDLGPSVSPQSAFQLIQGLETLPLRIQRQFDNAAKVADFLVAHPKVAKVVYPGLQTGLDRKRADKYLRFGYGGLVGFEPKGGEKAALGFIDRLKLLYHLANIGDAQLGDPSKLDDA
jgi:O-acetylhomoserine/O-acetylserine sulfhydrylase-like pyridoxal-dependent enzyme